jgi:hypothetical protein
MFPGKETASDDVPNTPTDVEESGCVEMRPTNVTASDEGSTRLTKHNVLYVMFPGKERASHDVPNTPTDVEDTGCVETSLSNVKASDEVTSPPTVAITPDAPNTPTDVEDTGCLETSLSNIKASDEVTSPPTVAITPDAVLMLFNGGNSDTSYNVQVFSVQEGYTLSGN